MNNITSVASVTQSLPDHGAAGGAESSAATAGSFSQLMAQFSSAAPATSPAIADDMDTGTSSPSTSMTSAAQAKADSTDEANETTATDPSLVAALLGQMHAPYALLTPATPLPANAGESAGLDASRAIGGTPTQGFAATNIVSTPTAASGTSLVNPASGDGNLASTNATGPELPASGNASSPHAGDTSSPLNAAVDAAMISAESSGTGIPAQPAPNALTWATDKTAPPAVIEPLNTATLAQAAAAAGAQSSPTFRKDLSHTVADQPETPSVSAVNLEDREHTGRSPTLAQPFDQPVAPPLKTPAAAVNSPVVPTETDSAVTTPPVLSVTAPRADESQVSDLKEKNDSIHGTSASGFSLPASPVKVDSALPQVAIAAYLDSPEWKPAFASSVKILVDGGISAATLQLNPAEFGPIDVRIVMNDKRADVTFLVSNPEANAALQSAMHELREQLARGGIQLGQASVGAHAQNPRQPDHAPRRPSKGSADPLEPTAAVRPASALARSSTKGQIDTFA